MIDICSFTLECHILDSSKGRGIEIARLIIVAVSILLVNINLPLEVLDYGKRVSVRNFLILLTVEGAPAQLCILSFAGDFLWPCQIFLH